MQLLHEELTNKIIGCAVEVHKQLGPGLLESAYGICLAREFDLQNISFEKEKPLPITYKGVNLGTQYRLDFVVDQRIVGELKAVETLLPVHEAQLLPYLKLTPYRVGLLFNFNSKLLTQNTIRRIL